MHIFLKILLALLIALLLFGLWFINQPQMDPLMTAERRSHIEASPHYVNGEFVPIHPHEPVKPTGDFWKEFLFPTPGKTIPKGIMISDRTDLKTLDPEKDVVVWMGHSSFYMQLHGKKILIDPINDLYASPVWGIDKAMEGSRLYDPEDIPDDIDVMVLSHDHWDHLDYDFVRAIEPKVKHVVTGLGNGGYYEKWGYPLEKIHEEDWWTPVVIDETLTVYVLPTRHVSGRLLHRNQTLPASFAFVTADKRVYYTGDGGYDDRFLEIGEKLGPFDVALIEDGQYNTAWHSVHMLPEEGARAAEELLSKAVIPCHNGKYPLSIHNWKEPYERMVEASKDKSYTLFTPKMGEAVEIGNLHQSFEKWWEQG